MVNEQLKHQLKTKIEDGTFNEKDLPEYISLFAEICNESDDIKDEIEGWNRKFQIHIEGLDDVNLIINNGSTKVGFGKGEGTADIAMEMTASNAIGIFTGELNPTSAYMSGDLKIVGPLRDAVKFRTIIEIVRELLED